MRTVRSCIGRRRVAASTLAFAFLVLVVASIRPAAATQSADVYVCEVRYNPGTPYFTGLGAQRTLYVMGSTSSACTTPAQYASGFFFGTGITSASGADLDSVYTVAQLQALYYALTTALTKGKKVRLTCDWPGVGFVNEFPGYQQCRAVNLLSY
jgi:hypothetical protein